MYREIIQVVISEVGKYADIKESTSEETNVGFIVTFYDEIEADEMKTRLMQDIAEIAYDFDWYDEVEDVGNGTFYIDLFSYNY
tara:strand:+ start:277 stop:525 length:249 start_codon:yes stop_codon:yes gene_type:complete